MLTIQVPEQEYFNELTNEFFTCGGFELKVEHSLNAISRWESKWKKPFLSEGQKTVEETRDYIRCMNLTPGIPEEEFKYLPNWVSDKIAEYITSPYTATTITNHGPQKKSREIITAEIIYYWMVSYQIPFECADWHYDKLMKLIQVCSIKSEKPKKMPHGQAMAQQRALNAQRRSQFNSAG